MSHRKAPQLPAIGRNYRPTLYSAEEERMIDEIYEKMLSEYRVLENAPVSVQPRVRPTLTRKDSVAELRQRFTTQK